MKKHDQSEKKEREIERRKARQNARGKAWQN